MLDPKTMREAPDVVKDSLRKRNKDVVLVDEWLALDKEWRELKGATDALRSRRNKVSEEINAGRKMSKDVAPLLEEAKTIPQKIKDNEERLAVIERALKDLSLKIPNILHESVPGGTDESANHEESVFGIKPSFDFDPLSHVDLCEQQDWYDLERAAKLSGARWYFLKGELARLELALVSYAVDMLMKRGFTFTIPPYMLGDKAYESVCDIATFSNELYRDDKEKLSCIATSEHPITSMFMNETLDASQLPMKFAGFSACFRKEAGSHSKDEKGIFRVHQFHKVEMVAFATPETSWQIHEELLDNAVAFFESLGLHGHVVTLCSGDIGHVAAKTYDIEIWFPVQAAFRECVSCSNCTNYQSVGLNTRYQNGEERGFVHTLNSTMVATTRALVAILENFQNPDGTVNIPEVLQSYLGGAKTMGKKVR